MSIIGDFSSNKTNYPIVCKKEKKYYTASELFIRGWDQDDIDRNFPIPDSRMRDKKIKGGFTYKPLYEIDRVHRIEAGDRFRSGMGPIDNSLSYVYRELNKNGDKRYYGRLGDGRRFGGTYGAGFASEKTLRSYYTSIFGCKKSGS